jgi:hypothetical protein
MMEAFLVLLLVVGGGTVAMFALAFFELIWRMPSELVEKVRISNERKRRRAKLEILKCIKIRRNNAEETD